jgi:hypothetical protein
LLGELFFKEEFYPFRKRPTLSLRSEFDVLLLQSAWSTFSHVSKNLEVPLPSDSPEPPPSSGLEALNLLLKLPNITEKDRVLAEKGLKRLELSVEIHRFVKELLVCNLTMALELEKQGRSLLLENLSLHSRNSQRFKKGIAQANAFFPTMENCHERVSLLFTKYEGLV